MKDNFSMHKWFRDQYLKEEIGDHHIEFFDELANKLGWDDFNHMERNSDDIPEYAKILFNMVCELSGKYPPFN